MKKLKAGVIGLGMGSGHARRMAAHAGVELTALADQDETRLAQAADAHGVARRYRDGAELLAREKLDIVCIATPNALHKPLAIQALESGAHVLCEKPMAMNADEAAAMIEASRRTGRRLMINFSSRFDPSAWAMKREVQAGTVGDIYYARTTWLRRRGMPGFGSWFGRKELSGGGPLIDLGVHRLDLALWLMDYPQPVWIMASVYDHLASALAREQNKAFDVEDFAVALIKFANGATLSLEASWAGHIRRREQIETHILGTRGGMRQCNPDPKSDYSMETEVYVTRHGIECDLRTGRGYDLIPDAMTHFADCILADKPHMATAEEGLTVQRLLDAIYASAACGRPLRYSDEAPMR